MKLQYVGTREFRERLGEFTYNDNEHDLFMKRVEYLEKQGWKVDTGCWNWGAVEVCDRYEFDELMADWKDAKKLIKTV